jgi:F-type H+-transporting ATPase subunit b
MHLDPWTLALQAANFLVLVWLLHRFLYRPILSVIDARRDAARKLTDDLEARNAAAAALQADLERQRAGVAEARDKALRSARDAADAEHKTILERARAEAEALKAEAQAAFERERTDTIATMGRDVARMAVSIVRRLLQETSGGEAQAGALGKICDDVRALPAETRQRIVQRLAADGRALEVVTAFPLDEPTAKRFSETLAAALGAPAPPIFRVDPSLIAGVEVHFPFTILRRTWAEDLARIESELLHDDRAPKLA